MNLSIGGDTYKDPQCTSNLQFFNFHTCTLTFQMFRAKQCNHRKIFGWQTRGVLGECWPKSGNRIGPPNSARTSGAISPLERGVSLSKYFQLGSFDGLCVKRAIAGACIALATHDTPRADVFTVICATQKVAIVHVLSSLESNPKASSQ